MNTFAFILTMAFCVLGTGCGVSGSPSPDLEVFDYSSGKTIDRIPSSGPYREIICKNVASGQMPNVSSAFFTIAQEGEPPNARLALRKRDNNGREMRKVLLPWFDAAFHERGVYALAYDATKIAYWKDRKHLHVRKLESGDDRVVFTKVTADSSVEQMAWPESGSIIFALTDMKSISSVTIYVLGQDGTSRHSTFTDLDYSYPGLSVSPDGKWIWAERKFKPDGGEADAQIVVINTETLKVEHVVPQAKTPQQVGHGIWSDDSKSFVFMLWTQLADTKKPADFYRYELADRSLMHIATGIGSDACISINNGRIFILKNHSSVHVFGEHDGSNIGILPTPKAGFLNRIPGTSRWVF
jgi:hypothetical protein